MLYDLNEKENRIYEFICDYMKEKGFSPTVRWKAWNISRLSL